MGKTVIKNGIELPEKYSWVNIDSPAFKEALKAINDESRQLTVITGPGGAGKSILYKIAYELEPKFTLCTATTGIAAFNLAKDGVPALTVHSALKIPPRPWYDVKSRSNNTLEILDGICTLLIDEVSMMSANLMDFIIAQVDIINERRGLFDVPLRVILFGDVMQLPPVVKADDPFISSMWQERYGEKIFFFNSPLFKARTKTNIELYDVYRQNDETFKAMLDTIRLGGCTETILRTVNKNILPLETFKEQLNGKNMMYLTSTNARVKALNDEYLHQFSNKKGITYEAKYSKTSKEEDFPEIEKNITLYIGQQVMCTTNNIEKGYQNGTIGNVVAFENGLPIVETSDGRQFTVQMATYERFKIVKCKANKSGISCKTSGKCEQIGCKSAYAVTFHKSQGLTLDAAYMDFSGWLADSSVYLGLSRLRDISGLGLRTPLMPQMIHTNNEAIEYFSQQDDV